MLSQATEIEKQRPIQRRIRELVLYYISAGQTSLLQVQWSLHWLCLNLYGDNGILRNTGNTYFRYFVRFHYHHINLNIANVNSIVPEEGWFGQPKYSTKLILLFYVVSVSAFQFQFSMCQTD